MTHAGERELNCWRSPAIPGGAESQYPLALNRNNWWRSRGQILIGRTGQFRDVLPGITAKLAFAVVPVCMHARYVHVAVSLPAVTALYPHDEVASRREADGGHYASCATKGKHERCDE